MDSETSIITIAYGDKLSSTIVDTLAKSSYELLKIDQQSIKNIDNRCISLLILDNSIREFFPQLMLDSVISISEFDLDFDTNLYVPTGFPAKETLKTIQFALEQFQLKEQTRCNEKSLKIEQKRLHQLTEIGIALSAEKNLGRLLEKILNEAQSLSSCDAVSLYLIDKSNKENPQLVFKLTQNSSITFDFEEIRFPLNNKSIAGHCALNTQIVNIRNAYEIKDQPYKFDPSFDKLMNYRTISILAIPITNNKKEVIGVLQFINRKRDPETILSSTEIAQANVVEFDKSIEIILAALASQAAIAIENSLLLDNINNLLDGFVHASVTAIEQRDPTTSGHSFRVADLTCGFAEALQHSNLEYYNKIIYSQNELREIRFASLLHDFGKVGVREHVLVKPKKLTESRMEVLQYRFELEKERLRSKAKEEIINVLHHDYDPQKIKQIHNQVEEQIAYLEKLFQSVINANEPTVLPDGDFQHLQDILNVTYTALDGSNQPLISQDDFLALSVRKGSLTEHERDEIQSHVVHTFNFLEQIPWTGELSRVPDFARAHHEKLDGSGYPLGLKSEEIPFPSKMMTICDIFDALVAKDRPYKKALSLEIALKIINSEADAGYLDKQLRDIFMHAKIYDITQRPDYRIDWEKDNLLRRRSICDVNLK